jgi:hypothetical protein
MGTDMCAASKKNTGKISGEGNQSRKGSLERGVYQPKQDTETQAKEEA